MFATPPLMLKKYEGGDFETVVNYVKDEAKYSTPSNGPQSNTPSENGYILNEPVFKNIKSFIKDSIKEYTNDILLSEQELKITQSWINKTETGNIHTLHFHPNSVISGVFYFNSHSSPIEFLSDRKDQFSLLKNTVEQNEFTSSSYTVPSQERLLILFPSYIFHRVPVNNETQIRYSMSFNTFPLHEIGSVSNMSYVKL